MISHAFHGGVVPIDGKSRRELVCWASILALRSMPCQCANIKRCWHVCCDWATAKTDLFATFAICVTPTSVFQWTEDTADSMDDYVLNIDLGIIVEVRLRQYSQEQRMEPFVQRLKFVDRNLSSHSFVFGKWDNF